MTVTLIFGANFGLGSALELLLHPTNELVVTDCRIKSIFVAQHNLINKWFVVVT